LTGKIKRKTKKKSPGKEWEVRGEMRASVGDRTHNLPMTRSLWKVGLGLAMTA